MTTESLEETGWDCQINPLYLAPFGHPTTLTGTLISTNLVFKSLLSLMVAQ